MPVGAFMFEADRRPHQPCAGAKRGAGAAAHRPESQISLAEPRLGSFPALQRADDRCGQGPGELRLPDEVQIAELWLNLPAIVAARPELAETAVEPSFLAVD